MSGGQAITSGQGVVTQEEALPIAGIALVSGAGTIVADAQAGIDLSGSVATLALGTAVSGPIIFLRSRKVGGGSAAAVLLGGSGVLSQGTFVSGYARVPVGALLTGTAGSFGKTRDRALTGSAAGVFTGSVVGQGLPSIQSAVIQPNGATVVLTFSQSVQIGSGGNGGVVVSMSGGASAATYLSGTGSAVLVFSLARQIAPSETGTHSYTQPGNGIESIAGGDVSSYSGITVTNNAGTLAWDASATAIGYRLYWGSSSGSYMQSAGNGFNVGNVTSYELASVGLASGTYFMVARAYNSSGESVSSNEIQVIK